MGLSSGVLICEGSVPGGRERKPVCKCHFGPFISRDPRVALSCWCFCSYRYFQCGDRLDMKVSANYQFDRIWNHLEDGPLGVAERNCLYNAKRGGGSPLTAGGTFPKWGTRTVESGERELSPNISSPCFLRNILKISFLWMFCLPAYLCTMWVLGTPAGQKRTLDPLKLELEAGVSCYQSQFLWKSIRCS